MVLLGFWLVASAALTCYATYAMRGERVAARAPARKMEDL